MHDVAELSTPEHSKAQIENRRSQARQTSRADKPPPSLSDMANTPLTKRQSDILSFVREYCDEHSISPTLDEIAAHFGVNKVTIFGHVAELERKGAITRGERHTSRSIRPTEEEVRDSNTVQILGRIAAGAPIETIEDPEALSFQDLVPPGREVYALRVKGDSMIEDAICDGDLVLVERRSEARNGETVVAVLPDEEATLKRFYKEETGIRLQPANSTMAPILVPEVEIRGVVISVIRQV